MEQLSMIQRIQQRQASGVSEQVALMDEQAAEAQKPDARDQMRQQRDAHGHALRGVPDRDLQEVAAGPEEQAVHVQLEKQLIEAVHGKGLSQQLLKAIFTAQDPVYGIGQVASDLVGRLRRESPNATEDVMSSIGERAVEEIAELVELADPSVDLSEDDLAEAYSIGVQNYMKSNEAMVNDDEVRGFLADG